MSRNASASHRPRPRIACWRHGPGSPAASARIQPVLRGSFPSNPSKNFHADAATRSWPNKGRSCAFTSRSEDAQSSSVASIDAPAIHDPPNHGGPWIQKSKESATVMLRISAQDQPVAVDLPALQTVQETHAEETGAQLAGLHDQRFHRTLFEAADGEAIKRDLGGAGAAVGGVDAHRIVEHFERQAGSSGILLREHHGACSGIEHHRHARTVDLRRNVEVAGIGARDFYGAAMRNDVAGNEFGHDTIGDIAELVS